MDHVLPRSRGGKNDSSNLLPACVKCNCGKHARTPKEWREHKELRAAADEQLPQLRWSIRQLKWMKEQGLITTKRHVFFGEKNPELFIAQRSVAGLPC
jgi:hypothetical protein